MNKIAGIGNLILVMAVCFILPWPCQARPDATVKFTTIRAENPKGEKEYLILPYAFPSDSMGTTGGVGAMTKGYGQKQLLLGATAFGSTDGAAGFIGGLWDYNFPWFDRLFFSTMGSVGYYPRQRAYTMVQRTGSESDAGGNDSDQNDYIENEGKDNWFELKLEYVLPMGSMKNKSIAEYHLKDGLLSSGATGGDRWNPLESGITVIMLKQFNRYQTYEIDGGRVEGTIHPLEFSILYNNTDFASNPSRGSSQYLGITYDNGWLESEDRWAFIEFEASKYFDLGETSWARQRVVAVNFWTGDSPTHTINTDNSGQSYVSNSPPFLEGARLGGFYRMRAYPNNRFNDRSVIYTAAEYRYTLKWNPVANIRWLNFLKMDWLQVVGFIEGGRVANEYNLSKLLSDWKVDAGVGFRGMLAGGVLRVDIAGCEEGMTTWVMFNQPF